MAWMNHVGRHAAKWRSLTALAGCCEGAPAVIDSKIAERNCPVVIVLGGES